MPACPCPAGHGCRVADGAFAYRRRPTIVADCSDGRSHQAPSGYRMATPGCKPGRAPSHHCWFAPANGHLGTQALCLPGVHGPGCAHSPALRRLGVQRPDTAVAAALSVPPLRLGRQPEALADHGPARARHRNALPRRQASRLKQRRWMRAPVGTGASRVRSRLCKRSVGNRRGARRDPTRPVARSSLAEAAHHCGHAG